jgi:hypothetical protein
VRKNGFGTVLDGVMDLVLLQFLTRNMFRHKTLLLGLESLIVAQDAGQSLRASRPMLAGTANYPCNMGRKRGQLRHGASVKLE